MGELIWKDLIAQKDRIVGYLYRSALTRAILAGVVAVTVLAIFLRFGGVDVVGDVITVGLLVFLFICLFWSDLVLRYFGARGFVTILISRFFGDQPKVVDVVMFLLPKLIAGTSFSIASLLLWQVNLGTPLLLLLAAIGGFALWLGRTRLKRFGDWLAFPALPVFALLLYAPIVTLQYTDCQIVMLVEPDKGHFMVHTNHASGSNKRVVYENVNVPRIWKWRAAELQGNLKDLGASDVRLWTTGYRIPWWMDGKGGLFPNVHWVGPNPPWFLLWTVAVIIGASFIPAAARFLIPHKVEEQGESEETL